MNIKFYMSDLVGPGLIRGDIPAKYINRIGAGIKVDCKMDIMESDFAGTQIMVFQRGDSAAQLNRMIRAKRIGIKVVYDIDDDLFNIPKCLEKVAGKYLLPECRDAMMRMHQEADAIFASSDSMAEMCENRAPGVPVFIIPNFTDFELVDDAYWNAKPHDGIVIAWHGSWSHVEDVPLVRDALSQILSRYPDVKLKIIGAINKSHFEGKLDPFGDRVIEMPWSSFYTLPYVLSECDIGICPLMDTQFNRVRSTIKVQEYQSAGLAVVTSPMECYKQMIVDEVTGLIVGAESTDAWINALVRLIEDERARKAIAMSGRKSVLANNDIRLGALSYIEAYKKVSQIP